MKYKTLVKAGIKAHKGILFGIFILVMLVSLFLGTMLTIWANSNRYIPSEITRAGFGELTAWVSSVPDMDKLENDIESLLEVEHMETQRLIFSNYQIDEQESDSEGQLIPYNPDENRYRFFTNDTFDYQEQPTAIASKEVYVSPSFVSMFGIEIGDEISFGIARNGGSLTLRVKGFYEDSFMGSSMIGMKGFLIAEEDYNFIVQMIDDSGINALAREGAMYHIFKQNDSEVTLAMLNRSLNENTALSQYTEFVHSADAISGFMLILQNALSGLFIAFVLILLLVVMVVLGHSMNGAIETDYINMSILKTIGVTNGTLRRIQLIQYVVIILFGMVIGLVFSSPISTIISRMMIPISGVKIPTNSPWSLWAIVFLAILLLLMSFITMKTAKITHITPMKAMRGEAEGIVFYPQKSPSIKGKHLAISIAIRQLQTGKKKYISACIVAVLLSFFVATIENIDGWLGVDGKGMMDAFNPADHDIGVQIFGNSVDEDAQNVIFDFTEITGSYLLAMPGVVVNGIDYSANVISEPNRFHILSGRTCNADNEIVVTEFVATNLDISIGDQLTVIGDKGSAEYVVSGIYSCANDMGDNIGMSREGYLKIGNDDPQIWCHHYFLEDTTQKAAIIEALDTKFGGDVHVHENTWTGLFGIISTMSLMISIMYFLVFLLILIITLMASGKILRFEQRDLAIYRVMGFSTRKLRIAFALRFGIVAVIGSGVGVYLGTVLSDVLVSTVMKFAGISNFSSTPSVQSIIFPVAIVTLLFMIFAYCAAVKIKSENLTQLITE